MAPVGYFPGMPKLTFIFTSRLKQHLPQAKLILKEDRELIVRHGPDVKAYEVFVDGEGVGRFTIRKNGSLVERNFFCSIPLETGLPPEAIEQGTFGIACPWYFDSFRILFEHVEIAVFRLLPQRLRAGKVRPVYDPSTGLTERVIRRKMSLLGALEKFDGCSVLSKQCGIDGAEFQLASRLIDLQSFTPPKDTFEIDVGGYCPTCQLFLCPKHIKFKPSKEKDEFGFRSWHLSCLRCGTKLTNGNEADLEALLDKQRLAKILEDLLNKNKP